MTFKDHRAVQKDLTDCSNVIRFDDCLICIGREFLSFGPVTENNFS